MVEKYPIIVCDDDQVIANELAQNINSAIQNITDDNESYRDLKEKVTFVANNFAQVVGYVVANDINNGIYFLDIELSQQSKAKNGVDLAEFIKKQDPNAQIIFVTAYDKYAPLTYRRRIGAIDYINKSLSQEKIIQRLDETLRNAFDELYKASKLGNKIFTYKVGRRIQKVDVSEIIYIENSDIQHKVHMVTEHGEAEFKGNISAMEKETPFLVKVSQSYLINPHNIKEIDQQNKEIIFDNDDIVTYSRSYKNKVNELIEQFENINLV